MKLAMVGLGKMGANMVRRLVQDDHQVVVFDVDAEAGQKLAKENQLITATASLPSLIKSLDTPRDIWLMVPQQFVDQSIDDLQAAGLEAGDLIIDG